MPSLSLGAGCCRLRLSCRPVSTVQLERLTLTGSLAYNLQGLTGPFPIFHGEIYLCTESDPPSAYKSVREMGR